MNAAPTIRLAVGDVTRSTEVLGSGGLGGSDGFAAVLVDDVVHVDVDGRSVPFTIAPPPDEDRAARAAAQAHGGGPADLIAPMPGTVIAVHAKPGDTVGVGDPIITLEAMKMEHAVAAPIGGRVAEVFVAVGDQVERATRLAVVEP